MFANMIFLLFLLHCRRLILELTFNLYFLSLVKNISYTGNYLFKEFSELLFDTFSIKQQKPAISLPVRMSNFLCVRLTLSLKIKSYRGNIIGLAFNIRHKTSLKKTVEKNTNKKNYKGFCL